MSEGFDVHALSDDELESLRRAVLSEKAKRKEIGTSPEKIEAAIAEYQAASGKGQGEPWEAPVSALDSYPKGAVVTHDGETWRSLHHANPHRPGEALWRLVPETDEEGNEIPPRYVQPSSAADAYEKGRRITHNGQIWEAVRDGVVHSPDEYAPDWQLVEPEPEPEPDPEPEPEEPALPEWKVGVDYQPGDTFTYDSVAYTVLQAHTSAAHWLPPDLPSLYERQ